MTAIWAPSSASAWQMRCPNPPLPPVTSATAPFSSIASLPVMQNTRSIAAPAFLLTHRGGKSKSQLVFGPRKQPPDIVPVLENDDRRHQAREDPEIERAAKGRDERQRDEKDRRADRAERNVTGRRDDHHEQAERYQRHQPV